MDILSIFEQRLKPSKQPIEEMEEKWNQKAEKFYSNQVNGSTYYSDAVLVFWSKRKYWIHQLVYWILVRVQDAMQFLLRKDANPFARWTCHQKCFNFWNLK